MERIAAFDELVQLARLMAHASSPVEMQLALADAAAAHLKTGVVVLRVDGDKLVAVANKGLPAPLGTWSLDADELDLLGSHLSEVTGLAEYRVLMLVVAGDIYGALVLLSASPISLTAGQEALADALVDLTAAATERAERYAALEHSYAELKASREALVRSERLRILGQMAAGISHDIKNILNPLGLQLEVARRRIAKGDTSGANETLDTMREVIGHGVDVVERLRAFSRQTPETPELVDVERVIATAVELSRPRIAMVAGIELSVTEPVPSIKVRARASELATAIVNLIVNATEAMPDGGTITISAGHTGSEVWIAVADNGPGIPPEIADNVFEPFFTTKREGTGLGLAMIYAFVRRFEGRITLDTTPGKGTRFTLSFPLVA